MRTPDYNPAGEITTTEQKQARIKAMKNLEKAKELETVAMQAGKRYKKTDNKTYKLI
jgi:tRNA A58 N-methylase Trm61